ncbi:MAG: signal peptidase I, partial [Pseudomonadota bacterium]
MAEAAKPKQNPIVETIKTIVYALLIAGVFRTFFFQPFWIPSGSMKDTLLIGDFLFVNKMAYGYSYASCPTILVPQLGIDVNAEDFCGIFMGSENRLFGGVPERGDVVVFRH